MNREILYTSKLIVGASGSGKTVTAKAEVAQLLDERREVVIIDPTGVCWGMRSLETASEAEDRLVSDVEDVSPAQKVLPAAGGASDRELKALAGLAAIYPAGLTEAAWAARTGYSRKGGAWIRRRKRYLDAGLIEQAGTRWFATPAGARAAAHLPDLPAPGPALVAWWGDRLGAAGRLLKALAGVHPRPLTRDGLAGEVGMQSKGGAYLRYLAALKAQELITETGKRIGIAPGIMGDV